MHLPKNLDAIIRPDHRIYHAGRVARSGRRRSASDVSGVPQFSGVVVGHHEVGHVLPSADESGNVAERHVGAGLPILRPLPRLV